VKQYEIIERIAVGGMAELYLARAPGLNETVVLKRLLPSLEGRAPFPQMFRKEAQLAATLSHPNIVQVLEVGTAPDGDFIAMEHLRGATLRSLQAALHRERRLLPVEHTLRILIAICAALHYAHEKLDPDGKPLRLVHRDVSPHNVIITRDGDVKLIDFGVAKTASDGDKTAFGIVKGKLAYMSPEQCAGRAVDRRSDVYSLGIILFELTLGRRLYYGGTEYETLKRIIEMPVPRPRSLDASFDPRLERIVMRALAKPLEERHQTARELQLDLAEVARARGACTSSLELQELLNEVLPGDSAPRTADDGPVEEVQLVELDAAPQTAASGMVSPGAVEPQPLSQLHRRPRRWQRLSMLGAAAATIVVLALTQPFRSDHPPSAAGAALAPSPSPSPSVQTEPDPPAVEPTPVLVMPASMVAPLPSTARKLRGPARKRMVAADPDLRGSLLIDSSPWCLVAVDGVMQGPTPIQVKLAAGSHSVRLRNSRFHINRLEQVVVAPHQTVRRRLDFSR